MSFQHDKGKIKHNALAALVTSNAFLPKKERSKKVKDHTTETVNTNQTTHTNAFFKVLLYE